MAKGTLDASRESELAAATSRLKEIYSQHIELEESVVFPRAARVLGADDVKAMGREFRARRE
jgi:hemerythrin-like domain-containing protein